MILGVLLLANLLPAAPDPAAFDRDVKPIVSKTCVACHNAGLQSGGVNLTEFTSAATVASNRPAWEKILQKVRSGEMPPKGVPRPPQPKAFPRANLQVQAVDGSNCAIIFDQAATADGRRIIHARESLEE